MADKFVSATVYEGGAAVQAFPLGGKAYPMPVTGAALRGFPADTTPEASLFILDVPPDSVLYVGRAQDLVGLTIAQARARMYPLRQGPATFSCTDVSQGAVRFLAEDGVTLDVRVLEAANL